MNNIKRNNVLARPLNNFKRYTFLAEKFRTNIELLSFE